MAIELTTAATGQISGIKSSLFLDNVDNTSDLDKPVSTAQQTYITGISGDLQATIDGLDASHHVTYNGATGDVNLGVHKIVATTGEFTNLDISSNIVVGGTVDGRDVAADGSIIDGLGTISTYNSGDYLHTARTATYTPSADYHPSTKKYVDDHAAVSATTTTKGHVELATNTEAHAATDTTRAVTPSNLLIKKDGSAIVAGNLTGNSRGTDALDVQSSRTAVTQVAGGTNSVAVGLRNTVSAGGGIGIGYSNTVSGNYGSSAFGYNNTASGFAATAVGNGNTASGFSRSSASGYINTASGDQSNAFGYVNTASGGYSSAFGHNNTASANQSSAFGKGNTASASGSSAFGYSNTASANQSSVFGKSNVAIGTYSSLFGSSNREINGGAGTFTKNSLFGYDNEITSSGTVTIQNCTIVGYQNSWTQGSSLSNATAVGHSNEASGNQSSAIGYSNTASGIKSCAFGYNSQVTGNYAAAFGYSNTVSSSYGATAVGSLNTASNFGASAFGNGTTSSGSYSAAFGSFTQASGNNATSVGSSTTASGNYSSAFGRQVKTTVDNTFEAGYWSNATTRGGVIRCHPNGQVAMTIEDSASAPTDGGATAGSEADGTLPREMVALRRNGTDLYVDANISGTINTTPLTKIVSAYKTTNEDKSNDTTLADDAELVLSLEANSIYIFEIIAPYWVLDGTTTQGINFGVSVPTSATIEGHYDLASSANWAFVGRRFIQTTTRSYGGGNAGGEAQVRIRGTIDTAATAGNFAFQWAQSASSANRTRVKSGAYMIATKIV